MTLKINRVPFEDALTMTGYSRYNLCMFLLSSSIIMGMCFELFSVSYLVPASVCELHTTSTQQGLIACVPLAGIILTSTIWGYLGDTRGRKKTLIISMTMGFIAGSFAAFSPHWIVLSVLKLISSASMAGAFALCITILGECTPMAKRSGLVILCTSVFLLISGLMAVIAIPILPLKFSFYIPILGIQFNSWRVLGLIYSFPSAVSALGVSFAYESPKFLLTVGKHKEAIQVLRGIYTMNTGKSADTFEVDEVFLDEGSSTSVAKGFFRSLIAQAVCLLKPPLMKHTILVSSLFVISYICINSFIIWLPYIVNVLMTSVTAGNRHLTICQMIRGYQNSTIIEENTDCSMNTFAMTMVFGIQSVLSVVNVMMSGLASCVGRKTIFIGIQLICGTAALAINSSPYWILSSVLIMVFISGIFNFGFLSTYSVDIFPTYVRATAVCLTLMLGRGSSMAGINILKQLMDHNCEYIFYIAGSLSIFGGLVGFLLPSDEQIFGKKTVTKV